MLSVCFFNPKMEGRWVSIGGGRAGRLFPEPKYSYITNILSCKEDQATEWVGEQCTAVHGDFRKQWIKEEDKENSGRM